MGTTQQKLNYLANAVSGIKSAIESRGVVVGDAPLAQYATKIEEIPSDNIASVVDKSVTEITADMLEGATEIGDYTFYGCTDLTMACIPNTVTSIGDCAFYGCTSLATILFFGTQTEWNSITKGTDWDGNTGTYTVVFGSVGLAYTSNGDGTCSVHRIGTCTDTDLAIPSVSPAGDTVTSIDFDAFSGHSELTSVTIPDSVTNIRSDAFRGCSGLTSVTIGNGVTSIGASAFYSCINLTSITIPNSVTSMGWRAFEDCSRATSVTVGNGVTSIGNYAFYNCTSLTAVYYTGDIAGWCGIGFSGLLGNPLHYAHNLYINNELVTDLVIPNSVTSIGAEAFTHCTSMTSVTIGNGVIDIGNYAFSGCTGLTALTIPDSVQRLGGFCFSGCTGLINVFVGSGLIYASASFNGCSGLANGSMEFESVNPPDIGSMSGVSAGLFGGSSEGPSMPPCLLYVPAQSVDTYKNDDKWSYYAEYIRAIGG